MLRSLSSRKLWILWKPACRVWEQERLYVSHLLSVYRRGSLLYRLAQRKALRSVGSLCVLILSPLSRLPRYIRYEYAGRLFEETFEDLDEVILPSPTSTYMGGDEVR